MKNKELGFNIQFDEKPPTKKQLIKELKYIKKVFGMIVPPYEVRMMLLREREKKEKRLKCPCISGSGRVE